MGRISLKPREIISAVIVIALLLAAISCVVVYSTKTDKKVSPGVFSRGALDSNGKHVDSDTCLYTEELIQCRGLSVTVDFEAKLEYEIYFYRADESFIGSTGRLVEDFSLEGYENAKYCRIVIIPVLKDGADKIRFWECRSYAKQLTVKVSTDQTFEPTYSSVLDYDVRGTYFCSPTDFENAYTVILQDSPFVLEDLNMFSGRTVSKIWVPVSLIKDPTQDATFTVYVLEGNGSARFKQVSEKQLLIPAGTFTELEQVVLDDCAPDGTELLPGQYREVYQGWYKLQQWVCFDVDISLSEGQTLGFGSSSDTVAFAYRKTTVEGEVLDSPFYNDAFDTPMLCTNIAIYFDVEVMD